MNLLIESFYAKNLIFKDLNYTEVFLHIKVSITINFLLKNIKFEKKTG